MLLLLLLPCDCSPVRCSDLQSHASLCCCCYMGSYVCCKLLCAGGVCYNIRLTADILKCCNVCVNWTFL